jgi:hypothetical protein
MAFTNSSDLAIMKSVKVVKSSQFKAQCIAILKGVAKRSEAILITYRGKPLVRVEPITEVIPSRKLGGLQGTVQIRGDIVGSDLSDDSQVGDR